MAGRCWAVWWGVAKGGNDRNTGPQRLIMNIKVSNWVQHVISDDTSQLPSSGQWRCLILEDGETLVWSGEDLKCCFYVFEKPWRRWMTFAVSAVRSCCFPDSTGIVYLCSKLMSMGWTSAIGTFNMLIVVVASPALPRDWSLFPENSNSIVSAELCCPTRGKLSKATLEHNELHVGRDIADSSIWEDPFRVSKVGPATRAVDLYARWLTQKNLLSQLSSLDGKRLLCHCSVSCRRPHHNLAESPTACADSGTVNVAGVCGHPRRAWGVWLGRFARAHRVGSTWRYCHYAWEIQTLPNSTLSW